MKANKKNQGILESILRNAGFKLRYEKGNFRGGYCLLEQQQTIVINKFYPLESQVNTLVELVSRLPIEPEVLDEEQLKVFRQVRGNNSQMPLFT